MSFNYCSNKCRSNSKEFQEKVKQTLMNNYGCEHPAQSKEVQKRTKQTNLEKYGCENVFQSEKIKDKIKQTCLEKYGYKNPAQSKDIQERLNKFRHNKSYDYLIPKFIEQGITPLFSKTEYNGYNKIYKWKCNKCGNIFESKIYTTGHNEECQLLPHCWKCYPRLSGESKVELELLDFIKQYFPNAHKDKKIIKPQELDIIIPELNLAIEYNGDYWHSIEFSLEKYGNLDGYYGRHLNKVLETNKKGYRLIHIWESDWINNPENIKNKLIDILQGKENLNFTEDLIKLDRSWYNNIEIPGYKLIEEIPPEIVKNKFNVENCGYLVYIKNNKF